MRVRIVISFLFMLFLSSCTSGPPLFAAAESGGPRAVNHIDVYTEDKQAPFKFRSLGSIENFLERDRKPVNWQKVDQLENGKLKIILYAKENEVPIIEHFLALPHDNVERKSVGSKRDMVLQIAGEADALVKYIFENKAVRVNANIYIGLVDAEVKTPITSWQHGPVVDPIELNLAFALPWLGENYEREVGFGDDTQWYEQMYRMLLHEYAHVVHVNAPSKYKTTLANEFVAHTVELCIGYGVHEFREQKLINSLLKAIQNFTQDREFLTRGKPFATSTTGGQLASTSLVALFSQSQLANAPRERWLEVLPKYCKMIVDAEPAFSNTKEAHDWITSNVQMANLPFLSAQ
jgi:hypothetical protein